jgi:hypothetical protein
MIKTMKLQLGQTICWDGIQQIVTAVSDTHARIATRYSKDVLRSVVIERDQNECYGNKPGTNAVITQPGNWPGDLLEFMTAIGEEAAKYSAPISENEITDIPSAESHKLRVGQIASYAAHKWAVAVCEAGFARILRIDGKVLAVENPLPCSLLQPTKTANLEIFLDLNSDRHVEITKRITAEEKEEIMKTNENTPKSAMSKLLDKSNAETAALMAGKTPEEKKTAKAAKDAERYAAKKAAAESKAAAKVNAPAKVPGEKVSYKGCATLIKAESTKLSGDELYAVIAAAYPGVGKTWVLDVAKKAVAKAAKSEAK